jgi:hypothetical protein
LISVEKNSNKGKKINSALASEDFLNGFKATPGKHSMNYASDFETDTDQLLSKLENIVRRLKNFRLKEEIHFQTSGVSSQTHTLM